jgi:hypothetical protein
MKNKILSIAILCSGLYYANAQEHDRHQSFRVGVNVGVPVETLRNTYDLNLGVDVAYLFRLNGIVEVGATTGLSYYAIRKSRENVTTYESDLPVEHKGENLRLIPVAATATINIFKKLFVGGDIGYAFTLNDNKFSKLFYYQPKIGYNENRAEYYVSFKGLAEHEDKIGSFNLGFAYNF